MFYVYGLIDPRDNQIHYVGITQNSPARRLASHISGGASAKDGWLTALIDVGFLPRIAVLQQAETYSEIFELETWWIKIAEQVGWPITNTNKTNRRIMRDSNGFVIAQPDCDEWQDVAREFEPANLALTDGDAIEQRTEGLQYDSHQRDRRRPRRIPIEAPAPSDGGGAAAARPRRSRRRPRRVVPDPA